MNRALYFFIFVQADEAKNGMEIIGKIFSTRTFLSYFRENRQDLVVFCGSGPHILWWEEEQKNFPEVFNSLWKSPVENQIARKNFYFFYNS